MLFFSSTQAVNTFVIVKLKHLNALFSHLRLDYYVRVSTIIPLLLKEQFQYTVTLSGLSFNVTFCDVYFLAKKIIFRGADLTMFIQAVLQ